MGAKKDYYKTLNISESASEEEIKKAYGKLALKHHPDRNPEDPTAEERFKEVSEAYETLKNPQKKKEYDMFGSSATGANFGREFHGSENPFESFTRSSSGFGGGSEAFGDFISEIFTGGSRHSEFSRQKRGADLQYNLSVSLEEAHEGCEKIIHFVRNRGERKESAKILVKIPAGVKANQKLKLRGEGDQELSHPPGDLFVLVSLQKHPLFERTISNIKLTLPISLAQATAGANIEVPTIDGKIKLKIPQNTISGKVFRLKNKGFAVLGTKKRGDMLVLASVDTPINLNAEQIKIIKKLDKSDLNYQKIKSFDKKLRDLLRGRKK